MFSGQSKLYYGTDAFRVKLLTLSPGEVLNSSPNAAETRDWMVISGEATLDRSGQKTALKKADRITVNGGNWQLGNTGSGPLEVLEVTWGSTSDPADNKPLGEVSEHRPWGSYTVLDDQPHFKLKQLSVKPGHRLSLQRHQKREEHWYVTGGRPDITIDGNTFGKQAGEYVNIPRTAWHRLSNPQGQTDFVEIIELQLGDYFGEDDIERRDDDYGRS